jgi:arabinogalactan oligomer / maltooligosaccharide transport system substrate-binding protein
MNTKLRFASLLAGVAILAAACGSGTATTAPSVGQSTAPESTAPESADPGASGSTAPESPSAEPLSGEITLWHSYGSGGGETGAFQKALGAILVANKDLKVNVVEQPFADIFNGWNTDVAAGGGPDMFVAPNDSLYSQAEAGVIADLTDALAGKLEGYSEVAVNGSQVDLGQGPKFFMVPESLKAVAMWYDKSAVPTPPTTTDELLAAVKDGSVKLGLNQGIYHNFGWSGAFGGSLMDDTGKCVADQGGWADALAYLAELKAAGAKFYPDGNAQKQDFQTGAINVTVDGPWQTADFTKALGDKLAVAPMPAGTAKASPLTGTDGWYINPNSKSMDLAVAFALQMVGPASEQTMTSDAGHVPAAPGVTINSPIVQGFADAAAGGFPRPQRVELNNFWGGFGDALNRVIDKGEDPTAAVATACTAMNEANGK